MILVTGGAGFIGSHLVDALCTDHDVVVVDDMSAGKIENLNKSIERIKLHKTSILDKDIKSILKDVDVVFHLAAQVSVNKSIIDPVHDLNVNGGGTLNLLENARDLEQFIYVSSGGAVYGEPKSLPVDENADTCPLSPYGVSKLMGEKYVDYFHNTRGFKTTILRYANVYGERQDPSGEAGVISIFIDRILSDEPLEIFGDGHQTRDFIHVSDVVSANIKSLNKLGVYNIGTNVETSVDDISRLLSNLTGKKLKTKYSPERKGEVRRISLSVDKAEKELGWEPKLTLKEGIEKTIEYFQKQN